MPQALLIAELCLKYGPALARSFQEIFTKQNPTQEDWDKVWATSEIPFESFFKKPIPTTQVESAKG